MRNPKELSISCIIPMHNEEGNAGNIIVSAVGILSNLVSDWEIVVIESGSTDGTFEIVSGIAGRDARIKIFHQDKREGMGSALRLGYSKCVKELICHLEADSPFDMAYFKKALPILLENDCVIGYRVGPASNGFRWAYYNAGRFSFLRTLFHVGYNLLLRGIFGLVVRDVNFSFKIFRSSVIKSLDLISDGWFIDAEILLELKRKGILPIEMPVVYKDRTEGSSTVKLSTPCNMIKELFKYKKHCLGNKG